MIRRLLGFNYILNFKSRNKTIHSLINMDARCNVDEYKFIHYLMAIYLYKYKGYKFCKRCMNIGK